jgi:hypothetical protein
LSSRTKQAHDAKQIAIPEKGMTVQGLKLFKTALLAQNMRLIFKKYTLPEVSPFDKFFGTLSASTGSAQALVKGQGAHSTHLRRF